MLILIQHNILRHARVEDEDVVEFDSEECLLRVRFGRSVRQAGELYGVEVRFSAFCANLLDDSILQQASDIVELVLDHGKLRPAEIVQHFVSGRKGL